METLVVSNTTWEWDGALNRYEDKSKRASGRSAVDRICYIVNILGFYPMPTKLRLNEFARLQSQ